VTLGLNHNHLTDAALEDFLSVANLLSLHVLDLDYNHIGNGGARALAHAAMPSLRQLRLSGNSMGTPGWRQLMNAPWFETLEFLILVDNNISRPHREPLVKEFAAHPGVVFE